MSTRQSKVRTIEEAIDLVPDGAVVGIGGFITTNKPSALIRRMVKLHRKDLTIVAGPSSIEVDTMIGRGMVKRLITPYMGAEALAPITPFFSKLAGRTFQVDEVDNGTLIAMLRAQIQRVPFLPVNVVGTSLCELNPRIKVIDSPFGGPPVAVVQPIELDVALIHASRSDEFGNVQHFGPVFLDHLLAQAAKKVIVQVERLVSNVTIRGNSLLTTLPSEFVDVVVEAPYGAHPMASQNFYRLDTERIRLFVEAAREQLKGESRAWDEYMERFVDAPKNHAEYCEMVGMQNMFKLSLEGREE